MSRVPVLNESEIQAKLGNLNGWSVVDGMLTKKYRFPSFMAGIDFVNKAAALAEEMNHHPDILIRFGLVTVSLITHGSRGLTHLDFDQAERLDQIS